MAILFVIADTLCDRIADYAHAYFMMPDQFRADQYLKLLESLPQSRVYNKNVPNMETL